jgi:hypothetical protein
MRFTWFLLGLIFVSHSIVGLIFGFPKHDYYLYVGFGLAGLVYSIIWFNPREFAHVGKLRWLAAMGAGFGAALASQVVYFWCAIGLAGT